MTTCPNCGQAITANDDVCPKCGFNLKKYREDFFTKQGIKEKNATDSEAKQKEEATTSRAAYRKEFQPQKQNSTVQKMIAWIRSNATIVFLLGFLLLIITSFSVSLGWICFFALMIWLYIVCDRSAKINQYTADKRLTEKINQIGSDTFNSIADRGEKLRLRNKKFEEHHPKVEGEIEKVKNRKRLHFNYSQLSVILMAFMSLVVLFSSSGASVVSSVYDEKMSISEVLLSFGGRLLTSGNTALYSLIVYLVWLLLILFPIFIIYNIFKNTKKSQTIAFVLSLIETVFLVYLVFRLSSSSRASTGVLSQLTSQLLTYAVSIGASTYFLIISSLMTTVLSLYNLFHRNKQL